MKFFIKKINIIFIFIIILLSQNQVFARDSEIQYTRENISNYFFGIISVNNDYNNEAFKHLSKVKSIKNKHSKYNIEFIRTLVLLEKFKQAFTFSKSVWVEDELFYEVDLLLGLNSFLKKDYLNAEKYFKRLNKISRYNLVFDNFVGNILISWIRAIEGDKESSFKILKKIPKPYRHITRTQNVFLKCYFDLNTTEESFKKLIENEDYNFSRYNFFLINYLLSKNKILAAERLIDDSRKKYDSNLLIKQTEVFFKKNENKKIVNFFDCKNPRDAIAEFFYVLANLYSSEKDYQLSNFYLQISNLLNNKFLTNNALLAENFYFQKKNKLAKKVFKSLKSVGSEYSWHASKNIASILLREKGEKYAVESLKKDFDSLSNPGIEHFYELANFYKDSGYYKESINFYTLALDKIDKDNLLLPKILDRRGTSYERMGEWKKAEKDLIESLKILPDQAHVLNYLAYSWVDMGINLDEGLEMLKKANELRENDGYIIDSLGWAYYAKKNYVKAEFFLQKAVELLPSDPIINDHYADTLWMLNKNIQARHAWNNILKLNNTEQKLKDKIKKKLIFGINKQL